MTTMISEVYSAFRTAGVPEQDARKAAEALSSENLATKNDITEVKQEITEVDQRLTGNITEVRNDIAQLRNDIAQLQREMAVVKWMLGIVIAAQVLPLLKAIAVI